MSVEVANDNRQALAGDSTDGGTVTDATAVVRFAIGETLRFLSHAETMRLWERAGVRAAMPIKYTQGFNPHAKLSLPLPRTVGVAADDERLLVRLFEAGGFPLGADATATAARRRWQETMQERLAAVLMPGLLVHEVTLAKSSVSFHPVSAQYVFALAETTGLQDKIAGVLGQECLVVDRVSPRRPGGRRVDVRPFLKSIRLDGTQAMVECGISDAGSIRVDEIMTLLNMGPGDLVAPIRRTHVTWKTT
jgi:hypothetical protein